MKRLNDGICGVILAAGKGQRLTPLSFESPKPLLSICNKPIMQYQIENMINLGINEFFIVVGHLKEKIISYFGDGSSLGVKIKYVEQKENLGIAHAVGQLEDHVNKPFLLFLGDIFFVPKNLRKMLDIFTSKKAGAVLAVKKELDQSYIRKNFTVILHKKTNKVVRVIEKPRYLTTYLKGCGIYMFDLAIFDAIRNTPRTAMRDEYEITTAIQILIEEGSPVYAADVIKWDMNVTVPCDLFKCNQRWLRHTQETKVVEQTARLHKNTKVINSVIGKDVLVPFPVTIRNSVILEGARIQGKDDIINSLVSSNFTVICDNPGIE